MTFNLTKRSPPPPADTRAFTCCTVPLSDRICSVTPLLLQLVPGKVSLHSTMKTAPAFSAATLRW